jgi:hypothetical protein
MPFSFNALARLVLDLCRLRGGPEDVAYSPQLLGILIGASIALDALVGAALGDAAGAAADSMLSAGVVLALCWVALSIRRLGNRYVQTASALLATGLVFSLLQGIVAWLAGPAPADTAAPDGARLFLDCVALAFFIWGVAVYAHIVRRALNAPTALAVALVVSWILAYWALDRVLLSGAG